MLEHFYSSGIKQEIYVDQSKVGYFKVDWWQITDMVQLSKIKAIQSQQINNKNINNKIQQMILHKNQQGVTTNFVNQNLRKKQSHPSFGNDLMAFHQFLQYDTDQLKSGTIEKKNRGKQIEGQFINNVAKANDEQKLSSFNFDKHESNRQQKRIKVIRSAVLSDTWIVPTNISQKQLGEDSTNFYKYWKQKANQYQQANFHLQRQNSSLQQQNQILRYRLQKIEKKRVEMYQFDLNPENMHKQISVKEDKNKQKVDEMIQKNQQQKLIIQKLKTKIKKLQAKVSIDKQTKSFIPQQGQKQSQIQSSGSQLSQTTNSQKKISNLKKDVKRVDYPIIKQFSFNKGNINPTSNHDNIVKKNTDSYGLLQLS